MRMLKNKNDVLVQQIQNYHMMDSSINNPITLCQSLYHKYASSQTYFYTNKINEIMKQNRTSVNIFYEDIEFVIDLEQNLKRWYQAKQYNNKLFTFKEYYFYHQDCPRIFMKGIQEAYAKWQDKRRDLIYKKLKLIYNETYQSSVDSQVDDQKSQNKVAVTHFLLDISDYNPYSKKYYLRVEAKKERDRKKLEEQRKNYTRKDLMCLKDQLSMMLQEISYLSDISTLSNDSPKHAQRQKPKPKIRYLQQKSQQKSKDNSTRISNSNSLIKFNFKKSKNSNEKLQALKEIKRASIRERSNQKQSFPESGKISPRYNSNNVYENQLLKSKSIFSVSNFGALSKQTQIKPGNIKKDSLKLNTQTKKLTLLDSNERGKKYQTQKKKDGLIQTKNIIIKSKSSTKVDQKSTQKNPKKQGSLAKLRYDEFSDKKLGSIQFGQFRMRSIKSQFTAAPEKKKMLFTLKPSIQIQKGKKILELRNW